MRTMSILLLQFLFFSLSNAQKVDSIKYANGYLFFHEYGRGEAIVLLTGGPGAGYQQLEDVARTLGKSRRVILLEQRGTGRSMPTPFDTSTINLQTAHADLVRVLDHLKLSQAIFVGHSWGAMLAMSFATVYPSRVTSLVLIAPGPFKLDNDVFTIYSTNKEARLAPDERKMLDSALQRMQSPNASKEDSSVYYKWELSPVIYDRNKIDSLVVVINKGGLNPKTGSFIFQSLGRQQFDLSKRLVGFTKPVHIITGAQDPMAFISYEVKILLPNSQLHWINKAGHFPMFEQPHQFYPILSNILR